jgi:hypothetical protein
LCSEGRHGFVHQAEDHRCDGGGADGGDLGRAGPRLKAAGLWRPPTLGLIAMFEKADRPPRVTTISLPRSLVERIDDFRFERRLSSRAEAIRELIEAGLQRAKETNRRNFS